MKASFKNDFQTIVSLFPIMIDAFTWAKFDLKKVESGDAVLPLPHLHTVICADTALQPAQCTLMVFTVFFILTRTIGVFGALLALSVDARL